MEDRLKFRIFYKPEGKMIYFGNPCFNEGLIKKTSKVDKKHQGLLLKPVDTVIHNVNDLTLKDFSKLMQSTGHRDNAGALIFEGDIYTQGCPNIKYIVEWLDTGFKGRQVSNKSYAGLEHFKKYIKIIGNIYENPELLEAK